MLRDPAGFFSFSLSAGSDGFLSVLPEKTDNDKVPVLMSAGGEHLSRKIRTKRTDDMIETRQYYPGDDSRRINWKAFAHSGDLFIRQGEEQPFPESKLLILLDLSAPRGVLSFEAGGLYLDRIISALSCVIEELRSRGQSFELSVLPSPPEVLSGDRRLCGLEWVDSSSLSPSGLFGRDRVRGGSCLLLTSSFSENALPSCRALRSAGFRVTAAVPVPDKPLPDVRRIRDLFFTKEAAGPLPVMERKDAEYIRSRAAEKCRELKQRGGAADAFVL